MGRDVLCDSAYVKVVQSQGRVFKLNIIKTNIFNSTPSSSSSSSK